MSIVTRIIILIILNFIVLIGELVIGYYTGSMTLIADSFHMITDIFALFISLYGIKLVMLPNNSIKRTYGWKRADVVFPFINAIFLLALCLSIVISAIQRFIIPVIITNEILIIIMGGIGLTINVISILLLQCFTSTIDNHGHNHDHSSNIYSVLLHIVGDALGSIGVIISALIIKYTTSPSRYYSDPVISVLIAIIMIVTTVPLLKKTGKILLHVIPSYIELEDIQREIQNINFVEQIHEFHIWQLDHKKTVASLHIVLKDECNDHTEVMKNITKILHTNDIHNTTIQFEKITDTFQCIDSCNSCTSNEKNCCTP